MPTVLANPRTVVQFEKYVGESYDQAVDFAAVLEGGESVSTGAVAVYDKAWNDVTATLVDGSASVNGTEVGYTLQGGADGGLYDVMVSATLNTGEVHQQKLEMHVTGPPAA